MLVGWIERDAVDVAFMRVADAVHRLGGFSGIPNTNRSVIRHARDHVAILAVPVHVFHHRIVLFERLDWIDSVARLGVLPQTLLNIPETNSFVEPPAEQIALLERGPRHAVPFACVALADDFGTKAGILWRDRRMLRKIEDVQVLLRPPRRDDELILWHVPGPIHLTFMLDPQPDLDLPKILRSMAKSAHLSLVFVVVGGRYHLLIARSHCLIPSAAIFRCCT
mmetsp:Transcript_15593/g.43089  ORF Transcript_15593/g.43089 Transcript_15593/m.43089 type:complete len:223 (+) Transcript_15593:1632-2300(+)